MIAQVEVTRREFLKTSAATGAELIVGFYRPGRSYAQDSQNSQTKLFSPNAWVRITPDNQVTVLVEKPEMGQGQRTVETILLAEELEVDFSAIRIEQAPTIPDIYQSLATGGSGGTRAGWDSVRKARLDVVSLTVNLSKLRLSSLRSAPTPYL